jgi:modulator of FtsH protease
MMEFAMQEIYSSDQSRISSYETSKVLRNTYALLAMTLLFSAACAAVGMTVNLGYGSSIVCSLAAMGLIWFVLPRTANSSKGILVVFAFTGLLGAGLGPILNHYLATAMGSTIVMQALAGTACIFLGLSSYALVTRKDFSFMKGFLLTGILVAFIAGIANLFFQIQGLQLAVSAMFLLLSSGMILWQTSQIIHGGETNYILATASLYVSLYNIFVSLLQILGVVSDD